MMAACFKAGQVLNIDKFLQFKKDLMDILCRITDGLEANVATFKKHTRTNWTQPLNKRKTKTAKVKSNIANLKSRIFNLPPFITTYFLKKLMSFYFISSFFQITPDFFQSGQLAQTRPQTGQLAIRFYSFSSRFR